MKRYKKYVPWWIKIASKILLSRLPLGYSFWSKIELFKHGSMCEANISFPMILSHAQDAGVVSEVTLLRDNINVLEFGPGDSISSAIVFDALGARSCTLVDIGAYASRDIEVYLAIIEQMKSAGVSVPSVLFDKVKKGEYFKEYKTNGFASLATIHDNTIDYSFSNAVVEHVLLEQVNLFFSEIKRISAPGAVSFHRVDLKDHLAEGLNNLRFRRDVWESDLFRLSGFYTNRLRLSDYEEIFNSLGLNYVVLRKRQWNNVPLSRKQLDKLFQGKSNSDLLVHGFDVLIKF